MKGGLSRKSQGFLFQFRMVFQQFHQFFAALYNKILPFAVAYNPLHLGMILVPSQQEDLSLLSGALRQVVNLFHKRAGGVHIGEAQRPRLFLHLPGHPVGADDQRIARGRLLWPADNPHPPGGQIPRHLGVVDDGPQGGGLFALFQ